MSFAARSLFFCAFMQYVGPEHKTTELANPTQVTQIDAKFSGYHNCL